MRPMTRFGSGIFQGHSHAEQHQKRNTFDVGQQPQPPNLCSDKVHNQPEVAMNQQQ